MSARYVFSLRSEAARCPLPGKVLLVQRETETVTHILLKLFGFLLFARERLQIEPSLEDDYLPFRPDLVQLDYEGRIVLWVECGECGLVKLDRLAVKAPDAEIWVVKRSPLAAEALVRSMEAEGLRRGRYGVVGLDPALLEEVEGLLQPRNEVTWYHGSFAVPRLQLDFNGLWFDAEFAVFRH